MNNIIHMKGFQSTLSQFKTRYFWDHTLTQPDTALWHEIKYETKLRQRFDK